jgi:hypothetical protein
MDNKSLILRAQNNTAALLAESTVKGYYIDPEVLNELVEVYGEKISSQEIHLEALVRKEMGWDSSNDGKSDGQVGLGVKEDSDVVVGFGDKEPVEEKEKVESGDDSDNRGGHGESARLDSVELPSKSGQVSNGDETLVEEATVNDGDLSRDKDKVLGGLFDLKGEK